MFKILNINNKNPLEYEISYDGKKVVFIIGKLINKRDKAELDPATQTFLINSYLDYKGPEFKSKLMNLYLVAESDIMESIMNASLHPLPNKMVHDIVNMFDTMDVFHYCKNVLKLTAPSNLNETFDKSVEAAGRGTRVQTYIVDDYFELVASSVVLKSVLGPIGHFASVKSSEINGNHKEFILYGMLYGTHIADSEALKKVSGMAEKIIEVTTREKSIASAIVIDKGISMEQLNEYILSVIVLQKIAIANIIRDNKDENIITKIYHYINNKLRIKGDSSNRISDKTPMSDGEGGDNDRASVVESYAVQSELPVGFEVEIDWAVSNINIVMAQLNKELDQSVVNTGLQAGIKVVESTITEEQVQLLTPIYKNIIDPRGIKYLSRESLINLIGVGYAYFVAIDHQELGNILVSTSVQDVGDTLTINTGVNKARIPQELKDKLDAIFPYRKVINKDKTINIAENNINNLANDIFSKKWYSSITHSSDVVPSDIKIKLTEYIIINEEICYATSTK